MAIDSTAELLFNITANADDATENIAKFRALMGKNLSDLGGEFESWSDEVLGEITTVQAAMTTGFAVMAAGLLAVAAGLHEAEADYAKYADQVSHGMKLTGMSAEQMSAMHSVAVKTGVDYDTLVNGLVRLESSAVKAAQGGKQQQAAFHALGITDKEVIAGQKDMYPLLEKVMDGFHNNASAAQKAALARDLFARGGPELLAFLSKGSAYLRENSEEAKKLGLILSNDDVMAARAFKLAERELQEQMEALSVSAGKVLVPQLEKLEAAAIASLAAIKTFASGGLKGFTAPLVFLKEYGTVMADIQKQVAAAGNGKDTPPLLPDEATVEKVKQDFEGISSIVESLNAKVAEGEGPWEKLAEDASHYRFEVAKAQAELQKLKTAGTITAVAFQRESAALSGIPGLIAKIIAETSAKIRAEETKAWGEAVEKSIEESDREQEELELAGEARVQVTREINDKLATQDEQGYAAQAARFQGQQEAWAAGLVKKAALTLADWAKIDQITMDGLMKIGQAEQTAWQEEQSKLQAHLESLIAANSTEQQKIYAEYQKSLLEMQAAEDAALKKVQGDQAKTYQVRQMYAQLTGLLTQQYQNDLNKLINSQGWQGVFGSKFAADIQKNQQLAKQWATSTNQSLLMVQVTMESLKEESQKTFESLAEGMGSAITNALIMSKSVAQAMEQVLESTLQSIAGQAAGQAIYALALGFLDYAEQNYAGATAAFTAAEIFGSIAAVATIGGIGMKAMMGGSGSSSGGGGSSSPGSGSGSGSSGAAAAAAGGAGQSQQQGTVSINIQGSVIGPSGISQLTDMINQAVYGNDVTLYASHNPQGVPL